jgi:hypothetical protein
MDANKLATWAAIATTVLGGGIWVGSQGSELQSTKAVVEQTRAQVDKLRDEGPPAIARLEAQVGALQKDIDDVKKSQDEILAELRKKK